VTALVAEEVTGDAGRGTALDETGDLEKILDNTPFLLTRCSRDLRYLYVSKAYAMMIGRASDEVSGKPIIDIMGPEGFETIRPYVETVLRGQRVEYEAEVHFSNVGPRQLHVIYVPERDEQSRVVGWIASITDITEHKKATEERDRLEKQLTHLMRVSTLDGLSGGIAHELNQPLASILANAEAAKGKLAAKNPDLEELAEILEEIIQEDIRADRVIRNLRGLLKHGEHRKALISLNSLLASTLQLLRSELVNRKIKVDTELQTDLPPISGDTVELQQVLINLMTNAMEAMASKPPSERTLSIVTRETKEGNVEVSIRDSGPGLSPDELKRIFEPFFTTKDGGLGLGLSICSSIVTSHGGRITLRNASGGGVVATVSLPKNVRLETAS
jgi:PAS domain S-box-containing protein